MKFLESDYSNIGKLLVKIQFLETLIRIQISLFNEKTKSKYPKIKKLKAQEVLKNSESSKQTMGQLIQILKEEISQFDNKEFKELLIKRNDLAHNLTTKFKKDEVSREGFDIFINSLWNLTGKYTNIFIGSISISLKKVGNNKIDISGIDDKEIDLIQFLSKRV